jgi:hypothetical protein
MTLFRPERICTNGKLEKKPKANPNPKKSRISSLDAAKTNNPN